MIGCAFVEYLSVLRGPSRTPFESFPTPWSPFADSSLIPLTDTLAPLVEVFSPFPTFGGFLLSLLQPLRVPSRTPFPTFGGSLSSLLQRLSGPSPFFVALRGYLFAFSWKSFLPLATSGGSLLSFLQPLRVPSRTPFPTFGGSLSSLLQRLRGPSWISFCLFVEILSPLGDLWRIPLEPSPTP